MSVRITHHGEFVRESHILPAKYTSNGATNKGPCDVKYHTRSCSFFRYVLFTNNTSSSSRHCHGSHRARRVGETPLHHGPVAEAIGSLERFGAHNRRSPSISRGKPVYRRDALAAPHHGNLLTSLTLRPAQGEQCFLYKRIGRLKG